MVFKRNGLVADCSEELHDHLILQNVFLHSLDKFVANFVGLDQDVDNVRVVVRHTRRKNSLEICFSLRDVRGGAVMRRRLARSAAQSGVELEQGYALMFRRSGFFHVRGVW